MIKNKININVRLPFKNITNQYTEDQLSVEYQYEVNWASLTTCGTYTHSTTPKTVAQCIRFSCFYRVHSHDQHTDTQMDRQTMRLHLCSVC